MSFEKPFSKENLDSTLKELAKEFRKLNGTKMPAEIVLVGGASILANYGFRETTYDIDAIVLASSAMKEAIRRIADRFQLPSDWLNSDFQKTTSFSKKLLEVSVYYRTFSNILQVRTVSGEYLVAMKMMAARAYKNDLSDIVGILWENHNSGNPISLESIQAAVESLYGSWDKTAEVSRKLLDSVFSSGDYQTIYEQCLENENQSRDFLFNFSMEYPGELKRENINAILESLKKKNRIDQS